MRALCPALARAGRFSPPASLLKPLTKRPTASWKRLCAPGCFQVFSERGETVKYFAYGSNLCSARLRERAPSAAVIAVARLRAHVLRFHKIGFRDGSGKCNAFATDVAADVIWGAVYEIEPTDKSRLDRAEGLGLGYLERGVEVDASVGLISATTYVATPDAIRSGLRPFSWYRDFVVAGANEHDLPLEYVGAIRAAVVVQDPNEDRAAKNEQVLSSAKRMARHRETHPPRPTDR